MVNEQQQAEATQRRNTSSSPGSAYQFRQEWYRSEFKSPKSLLADEVMKARSREAISHLVEVYYKALKAIWTKIFGNMVLTQIPLGTELISLTTGVDLNLSSSRGLVNW